MMDWTTLLSAGGALVTCGLTIYSAIQTKKNSKATGKVEKAKQDALDSIATAQR